MRAARTFVAAALGLLVARTALAQPVPLTTGAVLDGEAGGGLQRDASLTIGGLLYFTWCGAEGCELWRTDGSAAGTLLVKDIETGTGSSSPAGFCNLGGTLYFSAYDSAGGRELWKSDGTAAGTVRVRDVNPGAASSSPTHLVFLGGVLYFAAQDATNGRELWKSDGTSAGTTRVSDIVAGSGSSSPEGLTAMNGLLYFSAENAASGRELWRSDGTAAGTALVSDIAAGTVWSSPTGLVAIGGTLFFAATEPSGGTEIWKSDGSAVGTVRVRDINVGTGSSYPTELTPLGTGVFFTANDGVSGAELWWTDGTTTVLVKDAFPGFGSSAPSQLTVVNGLLFFTAADGTNGRELWKSDGTGAGTLLVRDIALGAGSSACARLSSLNGRLYFTAQAGVSGASVYGSDGTDGGTGRVASAGPAELGEIDGLATLSAGVVVSAFDPGSLLPRLYLLPLARLNIVVTDPPSIGAFLASPGTIPLGNSSVLSWTVTNASQITLDGAVVSGPSGSRLVNPGVPTTTYTLTASNALATVSRTVTLQVSGARPQSVWHPFFAVDTAETPYVGDFNGDKRTDIITFTRDNPLAFGDVYVSLSTGTAFGPNTKWHDFFGINRSEQILIGDFDGDGKADIGTWLGTTTRQVYVARSLGTGMTQETVWLQSIGVAASDVITTGDVNGDGKSDLVLFARTQGRVYVSLSNGASFGAPTVWHNFFAVSTYERPALADLNGDGKKDIVTFATDSPTAFGDVYVALSNGTQFADKQASSKWHDFFAIRQTEIVRIGDLNADSREDFFTFLPSPFGQCYTAASLGAAMGASVLWREAVAPLAADKAFVGDVNGDGKADIIIFAQGEGRVYVSLAP
jgi:ELWxxDGT repeat protein